ncbi:MAG: IclR family transcriptional regulator [Halothermotrichaceae bacterium]
MSKRKNSIKSVFKTFKVLEELVSQEGNASLATLKNNVDIPKSTIYRILATLVDLGYIKQNSDTGEYELGLKFLNFSSVILQSLDLRETARPILKKLSAETNLTVNLVIMQKGEALYIETSESNSALRIFSLIGKRAPLHATGVGKVLLAGLKWDEVEKIIQKKGLKQLTFNTITQPQELKTELEKIQKQGYAIDDEECEVGAKCIAAPVKNHLKDTIASISISAPLVKFSEEDVLEEYIGKVKKYAEELSELLGYCKI